MPKSSKKEKKRDDADVLEQLRKLAKKQKDKQLRSEKKRTGSNSQAKMPMTKEAYEKQRSIIKTEYDAQTGRMRYDKNDTGRAVH